MAPFVERLEAATLGMSQDNWDNLLKHCISVKFLLMEGYAHGDLRKELRIAPFVEGTFSNYFGKVPLITCINTSNKMPKHCIFVEFLLIES